MKIFDFGPLISFRSANVFNPWGECDPADAYPNGSEMRLDRLAAHFACDPKFLLVGEAPGYQGCHFSGVAFTNEKLLLDGIPRVKANLRITTRERPWSEPSATIMWKTLRELEIDADTVMWNAFAWHPFKPGDPLSNRAPTDAEVKAGAHVLRSVLQYFRGATIIAVGRVSERALNQMDVQPNGIVRHPSMGGAKSFREGMASFVEKRNRSTAA